MFLVVFYLWHIHSLDGYMLLGTIRYLFKVKLRSLKISFIVFMDLSLGVLSRVIECAVKLISLFYTCVKRLKATWIYKNTFWKLNCGHSKFALNLFGMLLVCLSSRFNDITICIVILFFEHLIWFILCFHLLGFDIPS